MASSAKTVQTLVVAMWLTAASAVRADDPNGPPASPSIADNFPADGGRAALAGAGVTYGANYVGEFFDIARGGQSRGSSYDGRVEGFANVDLEKFRGWNGGTFHVNGFYIHGEGPTTKHVGSIAPVSGAEALATVRLYEVWLEQALLDNKLHIRVGQMAADSEFWLSDTAVLFLNGTFGWPGIVAADTLQGGPAYPFATPGVRVSFQPTQNVKLLAGLFNSLPAEPNTTDPQRGNRHGTNFRFGDPPLLMLEGHFSYDAGLPGKLRLGGWKEFNDFVDLRTGAIIDGNHGLYAIVDQQVWQGSDHESVSIFARVSGSPDRQNTVDWYFDAGIVVSGLLPGRAKDKLGAAFGYSKISDRAQAADQDAGLPVIRDYEAVLEINYSALIVPGWTLAPDFQYFWNPGGRVADPLRPRSPADDAVVIGVRTSISY